MPWSGSGDQVVTSVLSPHSPYHSPHPPTLSTPHPPPSQEVPLLGQLLLAGGQAAAAERRWLLALLLAGLRTAEDAALYRRQHVAELAMSLADSCGEAPGGRTGLMWR
jgi:hypothetical protein